MRFIQSTQALVLSRLPRLRDPGVAPEDAFAGTFHINESYSQLAAAYADAAAGRIPTVVPAEAYCHSLTDASILSPELVASGAQTLTMFALHMPARLFDSDRAKDAEIGDPAPPGRSSPAPGQDAEAVVGRSGRCWPRWPGCCLAASCA